MYKLKKKEDLNTNIIEKYFLKYILSIKIYL